jgi:hypothetical protein
MCPALIDVLIPGIAPVVELSFNLLELLTLYVQASISTQRQQTWVVSVTA